jgi:stress response protein YsnF
MKDRKTSPHTDTLPNSPKDDFEEKSRVIPVMEETVHLDKKVVETGKVTVTRTTEEHSEHVDEMYRYEDVEVDRIPINEYINMDHPPGIRHEDDTTIVPIFKEVVVVEKKLLLVEELRITKKQIEKPYQTTVTLRKQEVSIERTEPDTIHDPGDNE